MIDARRISKNIKHKSEQTKKEEEVEQTNHELYCGRDILWPAWRQYENAPIWLLRNRTLTEYRREVAASAVTFRPANESSDGPHPLHPISYTSPRGRRQQLTTHRRHLFLRAEKNILLILN
ncbi:hypothetical protein EVAR_88092_1 [Eumeta japonica]|uniref:Uncharacterized protein n=1 Tax=Eumeta variegata TaxID=151549 RepID=A0A4C1WFP3_EUMVA|nr:hypothetical protein EVAR_88092_1 [Eumeta japonica]